MTPEHGAIIFAVAIFTYLTRIAGFQIGERQLPPVLIRTLDVAPIAAFTAFVVPGMDLGGSEMLPRLLALGVAGVLFLTTGRLLLGLLAGMTIYTAVLLAM